MSITLPQQFPVQAKEACYKRKRDLIKQEVIGVIGDYADVVMLRGSWAFDDFHLDYQHDFTHSDLDLIARAPIEHEKECIVSEIREKLSPLFSIRVSIHPEDHLTSIGLADSKVKNMLEYLIHFRNTRSTFPRSLTYMKAKIMLLLMKTEERNQRYAAIKDDFPGAAMDNLYAIKIGTEDIIDLDALRRLVLSAGQPEPILFYRNCIVHDPSVDFYESIVQQFLKCTTISPWLKSYIISKLKRQGE